MNVRNYFILAVCPDNFLFLTLALELCTRHRVDWLYYVLLRVPRNCLSPGQIITFITTGPTFFTSSSPVAVTVAVAGVAAGVVAITHGANRRRQGRR